MSKEQDIIYFAENIYGIKLVDWQKDLLRQKQEANDKGELILVNLGRRQGIQLVNNILISFQIWSKSQRISELEEQLKNAIVPKFKIGQDVFVFDWSSQLRSGRIYEIQTNVVLHDQQPLITYLVDFYSAYEDDDKENDYYEEKDVFITKDEAESKLKELRGE